MNKKVIVCLVVALFSLFLQQYGQHLVLQNESEERQAKAILESRTIVTSDGNQMIHTCDGLVPSCGYYEEMSPWETAFLQYAFLVPLLGLAIYMWRTRTLLDVQEKTLETPKKDT